MLATTKVRLGHMEAAHRLFDEALAAAQAGDSERAIDAALHNLGTFHSQIGNADLAASFYEQSLAIARRRGDRYNQAMTLSNLGGLATLMGKSDTALEYLREASDAIEGLSDRRLEAILLAEYGNAYNAVADYDAARIAWSDARAPASDAQDQGLVAVTTCGLGTIAAHTGDRAAKNLLREGRHLAETCGIVEVVAEADVALALVQLNEGGDPRAAARLAASGATVVVPVQLPQAIANIDVVAEALIAAGEFALATRVMHAADHALTEGGYNRNDAMNEFWAGLWAKLAAAGIDVDPSAATEDLLTVLNEVVAE